MPVSHAENIDCMEAMKGFKDKFFELAVVDPPYGETCNLEGGTGKRNGFREYWGKANGTENWNTAPPAEYFTELFRVSKNQIIWGGNHFADHLPASSGWVFWDKGQRNFSFSDGELAFTSFNVKLRAITMHRQELQTEKRSHPTQKPVKLYSWLLKNYAKPGDKILDTHMGSQSSRIAAYKLEFDYWGYEIDEQYFREGCERFYKAISEPLFDPIKVEQQKIFP